MPAPSWPSPDSTTDGDGPDLPVATSARDDAGLEALEVSVKFRVGDRVRERLRVGTITDVGTVLVQVKTDEGRLRAVCPWELVKILG
jgi:hypothetical protein